MVRQRNYPLATLKLRPEVVTDNARRGRAMLEASAAAAIAPATPWPDHMLIITEQNQPGGPVFRYELQSPSLGVLNRSVSKPIADRAQYVANIYEEIEQRWRRSKASAETFDEELREVGFILWDRLVPAELQELLWKHKDALESIYVLSEEPFIPWELVYMSEPGKPLGKGGRFLGEVGLVRWLYEANVYPPTALRIGAGRARYVIPTYPSVSSVGLSPLPEAALEAGFLEREFAATPVTAQPLIVRALLSGPDSIDLFHFAGHAFAASDKVNQPKLVLEGEIVPAGYVPNYLPADAVESRANFGASRPIIVLNACQAGRQTWSLTGLGGFAQAFLRRQAGAFIGALWSVGDAPARTFTETLYLALKKGRTMSEAVREARQAARREGDASWLAYAVYAHPDATLHID